MATSLPVRAEMPPVQQLSPQKVAQLQAQFMDYGWRTRETARGNGGLEYFDPETGLIFIPQLTGRDVAGNWIEDIAGFSAYDPQHPLWQKAKAERDNFAAMGAPIMGFDAAGNFKGATTFTDAKKNSAMDWALPALMIAAPFALTIAGVGAGAAAGAGAGAGGGAGAAGTTFGVVDGTVGAAGAGSTGAMGAGSAGLSGTGLSMGAGGVTGLTPAAGTGLSLTGTSVAPGMMTAAAPGAGAIGAGLGTGLAGGTGTLLGPAALAGTTALSTGLTLPSAAGAAGAVAPAAAGGAGGGGGGMPPPANPFVNGGGSGGFDWSSLVGPATSLIGGGLAANAAGDAAEAQVQSTRESNALLERMFNKQIELHEPFRKTGLAAGNRITELLGIGGDPNAADYGSAAKDFGEAEPTFTPWTKEAPQWRDYTGADLEQDRGYQFRLSEGQKLLERTRAGKGGYFSGATGKALTRYGQDYASGEFDKGFGRHVQGYQARVGDYTGEYGRYLDDRRLRSSEYSDRYNRFQSARSNKLNPYLSLYGSGQTSANTVGSAAANYGNQAAQNITAGGNARAAGAVGQANAWSGALGSAWGSYQENELMKKLLAAR